MNWDYHTYSWMPDMFKPVMNCAFAALFIGIGYLWLRFMSWTIKK